MPLYQYKCGNCSEVTERLVKLDQRRQTTQCNECEGGISSLYIGAAPALSDGIKMGLIKPGAQYDEIIDKIKSNNPNHTIK